MHCARRASLTTVLLAALLTAMPVGAAAPAPASTAAPLGGPGSLAGVWTNSDYDRGRVFDPTRQVLRTVDGKMPPLRPWAAALLQKRLDAAKKGDVFVTPLSQCLPSGVPAMMFYPALPIQFLEADGQVTILNEQLTTYRMIRLNAKHDRDPDPSYFGDSVGRWEGDTLVVDTIGLTTDTTLDQPGMPHSEELHVVERYRRTAPNEIELKVTIDDPKTFYRPWATITHFKREPADRRIEEYICENNRNLSVKGAVSTQMPSPDRNSQRQH